MDKSDYFLKFPDVESFAGSTKSRNYVCGYEVADAKHLMYVGITKLLENELKIIALCLQSSQLTGKPHEINLKITYDTKEKIIECKCSCAAGASGQCKHSTALLIHLCR